MYTGTKRGTDRNEYSGSPGRFHCSPVNQMRCSRNDARNAAVSTTAVFTWWLQLLGLALSPWASRYGKDVHPCQLGGRQPTTLLQWLVVVDELVRRSWHADRRHLFNVDLCRAPDSRPSADEAGRGGGVKADERVSRCRSEWHAVVRCRLINRWRSVFLSATAAEAATCRSNVAKCLFYVLFNWLYVRFSVVHLIVEQIKTFSSVPKSGETPDILTVK